MTLTVIWGFTQRSVKNHFKVKDLKYLTTFYFSSKFDFDLSLIMSCMESQNFVV
jgi:hypothetical protein